MIYNCEITLVIHLDVPRFKNETSAARVFPKCPYNLKTKSKGNGAFCVA